MQATRRPITVVALMLALFMAAMEMTVVSTAMPTAVAELGGIRLYSWVFATYMVASTVTVPIFGKLADLYGRKPIMLFGTALFLAASMACGQAPSMTALVVFRAIQGIGAGAMQPTALTIIGDIFSIEERARMQGLFGAVWGAAGLMGPLIGGLIVSVASWRWVFYVNLPFGVASALLLVVGLRERIERRPQRLDVLGAAILTTAVLVLLIVGHGPSSYAALPVAAVLIYLFIRVERAAPDPLLPLDLFKQRVIFISSAAGALVGGAMIATVTYVPLFVQGVLGGSPTDAGGAITPMVIGWPLASALSGRMLPRVGYRPLIRVGFLISAVAAVVLAILLRPGADLMVPRIATAFFGVGMGLANTALLIAVQSSVSFGQRGVATASTMFFRTIGGALAVGGLGGFLATALTADPSVPADAVNELLGPERGTHLDAALLERLSAALAASLVDVFAAIAALAVVGFGVSLFFPKLSITKVPAPEPPS